MKTMLLLIMLPLLAFGQSEKELKKAEKERLKKPAQVTVSAPSDRIKQALVREMATEGWTLDNEGQFKLAFSRSIKGWAGFAAQLAHGYRNGVPPRASMDFTIIPSDQTTVIVADIGITAGNAFGKMDRTDYNENKKARADVESFLARAKAVIEGQSLEAIKPPSAPFEKPSVRPDVPMSTPTSPAESVSAPAVKSDNPKKCYESGRKVPCPY